MICFTFPSSNAGHVHNMMIFTQFPCRTKVHHTDEEETDEIKEVSDSVQLQNDFCSYGTFVVLYILYLLLATLI